MDQHDRRPAPALAVAHVDAIDIDERRIGGGAREGTGVELRAACEQDAQEQDRTRHGASLCTSAGFVNSADVSLSCDAAVATEP